MMRHGPTATACITATADEKDAHLIASDAQGSLMQSQTVKKSNAVAFDTYGNGPLNDLSLVAFKGERYDVVGCQYPLGMGYRFYIPALRRFNSPDSESPFNRGNINSYAFVSGDPVNFSDPSGHYRGRLIKPSLITKGPFKQFGSTEPVHPNLKSVAVATNPDGMTVIRGHGDMNTGRIGDYRPKELLETLNINNVKISEGPIHLISCEAGRLSNSYAAPSKPVGQILAKLTNRPVTTYKNEVNSSKIFDDADQLAEIQVTANRVKEAKPITFYPSRFQAILSYLRKSKT